ncbi:hypothetical protein ACEWY4_011224 [Coilia grayii]|uniref:Fe2OG dioxygenase domain-containing protein n=1 Tax=Coilia grayii TaxID=363190 RepID=A0ABD1K458_9TELE
MEIPIVNFEGYTLEESNISSQDLQKLCNSLKTAFTEVGFVYLKNTGITQHEVDEVMKISKEFFDLPAEMKLPLSRSTYNDPNHGWVSLERERLNPQRPGDLKEAFNTRLLQPDIKWPENVPGFREKQVSFFMRCKDLSLKVLKLMGRSLGLDPDVFVSAHKYIGTDKNGTTLRTLYYPPVQSDHAKEGQLRCGEHSDYGSITLVFQSPEGGLEVLSRSGEYISAPYIPGTALLNIADLMQRWTSDVFISAVHRVLLPPSGNSNTRQSLAFFVHPDDEALITCCDGSNKYPPVNSVDYLMERFKESYGRK